MVGVEEEAEEMEVGEDVAGSSLTFSLVKEIGSAQILGE